MFHIGDIVILNKNTPPTLIGIVEDPYFNDGWNCKGILVRVLKYNNLCHTHYIGKVDGDISILKNE